MERAPRLDRTALVVDDDVFVLSALAELLSEEGFDVHTASNGFSASRLAAECRPSLILLDLVLPERSGSDVLAELRGEPATRDTAIVVVTGHADSLCETQLADIDGLVAKPFDIAELMSTIHRALHRAATRHLEVARVSASAHREQPVGVRYASAPRRTRGRR
jgi:two-component system KDP operon response regulator KdpE